MPPILGRTPWICIRHYGLKHVENKKVPQFHFVDLWKFLLPCLLALFDFLFRSCLPFWETSGWCGWQTVHHVTFLGAFRTQMPQGWMNVATVVLGPKWPKSDAFLPQVPRTANKKLVVKKIPALHLEAPA